MRRRKVKGVIRDRTDMFKGFKDGPSTEGSGGSVAPKNNSRESW
jgi:hypothetical protein